MDTARTIRDASITADDTGMLLRFVRDKNDGGAAIIDYSTATNVNVAYLSDYDVDGGVLGSHQERGSFALSFGSPAVAVAGSVEKQQAAAGQRERLMVAHGSLMAIAWIVLLPLGAVFARQLKAASPENKPTWFKLHVFCQLAGLTTAIAGWSIALANFGRITDALYHHGEVGTAVMALAIFQPLNALLRPHTGPSMARRVWDMLHWGFGKAAIILATVNVILGILIMTALPQYEFRSWFGGWAAAAAVIALLSDHLQRQHFTTNQDTDGAKSQRYITSHDNPDFSFKDGVLIGSQDNKDSSIHV